VGEKLASPSPYLLFISTIGDNCEKEQGTMWWSASGWYSQGTGQNWRYI